MKCSLKRPYLLSISVRQELDQKVEWFESKLLLFLDKHTKILYVSPFSKRWWNDKVVKTRKVWTRAKKIYERDIKYKDELKQAHNIYYYTIKKTKCVCWQKFLQE